MDWGQGRYERIAEQLLPVAEELIAAAAPGPGERVADLGTGTGNGALLAAERGARVVGVDPAERLLSVAAERARERGLDLDLRVGTAEEIPLEDGSVDLVTSVLGVVFAADAGAAAAEMARVAGPAGRIVLSAWVPAGPIADAGRIGREAVAAATGAQPGPPPFPWHQREALAELLGPHGFSVAGEERTIPFRGPSPREWLENEVRFHPVRVAAEGVLSPVARDEVARRSLQIFEQANEDPGAFRVTSRYVIATATRDG
ncbi:MAG TPA: methyltransferase domain-containing protein [Solirubrobacterales bacterium]|jgi:SAM-dependent methyltransferase